MANEKATFAAGCFWGVESAFRNTPGVLSTAVGYTGGHVDNPTYKQVCSDTTGHAEAVEVVFDPDQVSYDELLETFWDEHDPTQLNRQGPDFGTQYRTAIFTHSAAQEQAARESLARRQEQLPLPIVTQIAPVATFWPAEDYHQQYYEKRGMAPACKVGAHASMAG
jgi:peptide-methionine (S)-S-oxide reductase